MPKSSKDTAFIVRPQAQFLRAANLERDFLDPGALNSFILTDLLEDHLEQIIEGLEPSSGKRAWRMTGDYGSGKSTFALVLAHLLSGKQGLPKKLTRLVPKKCPELLPLLVTGGREPIGTAVARAIKLAMDSEKLRLTGRLKELLSQESFESVETLEALHLTRDLAIKKGIADGVLLIVDELGKLLEFAAMHPEQVDVYTWQLLAEDAMRSRERPLVVIGLLHQGFSAYAAKLGMTHRREWEKVAGLFCELNLHHPTSQLSQIVAGSLNIDTNLLPTSTQKALQKSMKAAETLGWYGHNPADIDASALYPLDPFVLPVLSRLLHTVGQNERSLFGFLFGGEPYSLLRHVAAQRGVFRLCDLYDYAYANLNRELEMAETAKWPVVQSMVAAHADDDALLPVLKTVALLNVTGGNDLLATKQVVCWACGGSGKDRGTLNALEQLQSDVGRRAIYDRGAAGGLCLWAHTSFDIHAAQEEARKTVTDHVDVESFVRTHLKNQGHVVARKHYIETGNLRYFSIVYLPPGREVDFDLNSVDGDGAIVVSLYDTPQDAKTATGRAMVMASSSVANVIAVVPALSLSDLRPYAEEASVWELVASSKELSGDPYARDIVSKRKHYSFREFEAKLKEAVGLESPDLSPDVKVYYSGKPVPTKTSKELVQLVSKACEDTYKKSPKVKNELLNRRSLSSAAAAARMRLIEGVLERRHEPFFGMDPTKAPPEMSMYRSVFKNGQLHQECNGVWDISAPKRDPLNLSPSLREITKILTDAGDDRVPVDKILDKLGRDPYGVSSGLACLVVAIYFAAFEKDVALYEDGCFLPAATGADFMRLTKKPSSFALQRCKIEGVRSVAYHRLSRLLSIPEGEANELLDVIRPLCIFAANLPEFVHKTKQLSPTTLAIRSALLDASDPTYLLFVSLPKACGLSPITEKTTQKMIDRFVEAMESGIAELRECYLQLLSRISTATRECFSCSDDWRDGISERASALLPLVSEPKLKAFCFRLADKELSEEEWLESVASLVQSKPPERWGDGDESLFLTKLSELTARFSRTEAVVFESSTATKKAIRLCLTSNEGNERARVMDLDGAQSVEMQKIQKQIDKLIKEHGEIAMVAASQALWKRLPK